MTCWNTLAIISAVRPLCGYLCFAIRMAGGRCVEPTTSVGLVLAAHRGVGVERLEGSDLDRRGSPQVEREQAGLDQFRSVEEAATPTWPNTPMNITAIEALKFKILRASDTMSSGSR